MPLFRLKSRFSACLLVVFLLILSAQLQRFLQQYKESTESGSAPTAAPSDFAVYYTAAVIARQNGHPALYYPAGKEGTLLASVPSDTPWGKTARAIGFDSTMHFIYPPFAALLLEPLGMARWQISLLAWRLALSALMLISIYLTLLLAGKDQLLLKFVIAAAAVFCFFPFIETLFQGQIDPIILLLWVAGIYLLRQNWPIWSALCFALGTMMKVSPVLVVGLFLLRRQWKWLFGYVAWIALLAGISVWQLGWQNHVLWFTQILPGLSRGVAYYANKAPAALIFEMYLHRVPIVTADDVPSWLVTIVKGISLIAYCGVLFYFWKKNRRPTSLVYELVTLALVAILISPVSWRHHYVLTLIPLIYLWLKPEERGRDTVVLAATTLAMGTAFPDYVMVVWPNPALDLLLSSLIPITAVLFLLLLCKNYEGVGVVLPSRGSRAESLQVT